MGNPNCIKPRLCSQSHIYTGTERSLQAHNPTASCEARDQYIINL